ncbi:protein of unknown function [Nitrospina watsonii]|uniref:DUF3467 domain-containing protein n=1 Tax=Nitrospina watsonii TaxID=1323948 RepID=A0ABM9HGF5_9BACT|nr:protein of unknown function [Nitrospina watsonii]
MPASWGVSINFPRCFGVRGVTLVFIHDSHYVNKKRFQFLFQDWALISTRKRRGDLYGGRKKATAAGPGAGPQSQQKKGQNLKLNWDDSKMQTTYTNVVNASSTREEVSIFFGTNQTWNVPQDNEVTIQLSDRMVLNPFAAKRLLVLLNKIISEYEERFGRLPLDGETK